MVIFTRLTEEEKRMLNEVKLWTNLNGRFICHIAYTLLVEIINKLEQKNLVKIISIDKYYVIVKSL